MTLQTAVTSAAIRTIGSVPAAVFSSQAQLMVEMRDLVQDVAVDIAKSAEWRALTKIGTLTGGLSFPLPDDYDRMLVGQGMQDQLGWFWGYLAYADVSEYIMAVNGQLPTMDPGGWIILDGAFKFWPATSGTATYPYISKYLVRDVDGVTLKEQFTADTDTFVLSERLLTLGLIWRYRAQKGLEYAEDMQTYATALDQLTNSDKGARVLRPDLRRIPGSKLAYTGRVIS
jgi:hypothetical protein